MLTCHFASEPRLFVAKLPRTAVEKDVREVFEPFGELKEIKILVDPTNGQSRGCAFVVYRRRSDALAAIQALNNIHVMPGNTLAVNVSFAETPQQKQDRKKRKFIETQHSQPPIMPTYPIANMANMANMNMGNMATQMSMPAAMTAMMGMNLQALRGTTLLME